MPTIVGFEEPRVVKRRNISETARNSDLVSSVGAGSTSMRANFTRAEPYFHSTFDFQMIALCGAKDSNGRLPRESQSDMRQRSNTEVY